MKHVLWCVSLLCLVGCDERATTLDASDGSAQRDGGSARDALVDSSSSDAPIVTDARTDIDAATFVDAATVTDASIATDSAVSDSAVPQCPRVTSSSSSATGPHVFAGTTVGALDLFQAACLDGPGPEVVHEWIAPRAGRFVFDTVGSATQLPSTRPNPLTHDAFAIGLVVIRTASCAAASVDAICNHDAFDVEPSVNLDAAVGIRAAAGERFIVVVDSAVETNWDTAGAGRYQINVTELVGLDANTVTLAQLQRDRAAVAHRTCESPCSTYGGVIEGWCAPLQPTAQQQRCEQQLVLDDATRDSYSCQQYAYANLLSCLNRNNNVCVYLRDFETPTQQCLEQYALVIGTCPALPRAQQEQLWTCMRGCPGTVISGPSYAGQLPDQDSEFGEPGPEQYLQWTAPSPGIWLATLAEYEFFSATGVNSCLNPETSFYPVTPSLEGASLLFEATSSATTLKIDSTTPLARDYHLRFTQLCPSASMPQLTTNILYSGVPSQSDPRTPACGQGSLFPTQTLQWIPPAIGRYEVIAHHAEFALYRQCTFAQRDCSSPSRNDSRMAIDIRTADDLHARQFLVAITDPNAYDLIVREVPCPTPQEIVGWSATGVISRSTDHDVVNECMSGEAQGQVDHVLRWVAPTTGAYQARATTNDPTSLGLVIIEGSSCSGSHLGCQRSASIPIMPAYFNAVAGQSFLLAVYAAGIGSIGSLEEVSFEVTIDAAQ